MVVNMMVVDIAKSQLGYKEVGSNNNNMYGKWYGANNQPWCAMFVSWVFDKAGIVSKVAAQTRKGFASCDAGLKWFTKKGKIVPVGKAQPGDIVFFQFDSDAQPDHVGICASNDGKKYLTVYEGNTSSGSKGCQSNGDGVYLRKRAYSLVMGVARP
jgi:cell wall-associated NlpC family hydrolase